ncbi:MAG: P-loop NTPase fold protein [Sulfolobaceae archaeon]
MVCKKRISETSAISETIYRIFQCVSSSTRYIDRLKFVRTVLDEVKRLESNRESPEIVVIKADWGVGKSTFLNLIQEFIQNKVNYRKIEFLELLRRSINVREFTDGIYLIDEVESAIDDAVKEEYKDKIVNFWLGLKELSNSRGGSIIYLSMTPTAYYKIFGPGGLLQTLFTETYPAFRERIRTIEIDPPNKLEFILIINCLMKFNEIYDTRFLRYLDLAYFVTRVDRRRYIRLFNDIICNTYPDILKFFNEIARGKVDLNDEGETVKISELAKLEKLAKSDIEVKKLYSALLARIINDDEVPKIMEGSFIKGVIIPYSDWIVLVREYNIDPRVEDFLITIVCEDNEDEIESCIKVFVTDRIREILPESIEYENYELKFKDILNIVKSKKYVYALKWSEFSNLVNTNVEEYIIEVKDKNLLEKINKFINQYLLRIDKELEGIYLFIRYITGKDVKFYKYSNSSIEIRLDKYRIILADITSRSEYEDLLNRIIVDNEIIDGILLINNEFINSNIEVINKLSKICNELSISLRIINIPISKKKQILYFLILDFYKDKIILKDKNVEKILGKIKEEIISFIEDVEKKRRIIELPLLKGGKRIDSSINWILFYPGLAMATIEDVFNTVNEIVNEKFRIYGSKQFRLEDFETERVLKDELIPYFSKNGIIKYYNGLLDFQDLLGEDFKVFTKNFAGYLKQVYKSNLSKILFNYILYISGLSQDKSFKNFENTVEKLYSKSATVEFLSYLAIASGELIRVIFDLEVVQRLKDHIDGIVKKIEYVNERFGIFLTVKKRDVGLRSLKEMRTVLLTYKHLIDEAYSKQDIQNFVRLSIVFLYLYNLYNEQIIKTEESIIKINNIISNINRKFSNLSEVKKFLGVNDELEEEKKIMEVLEKVSKYDAEDIKRVLTSLEPEDLRSKLIEKVLEGENNNTNLFLIICKLIEKVLEGERFVIPKGLNGTIFSEISNLSDIGNKISQVFSLYEEIKLNNPKIRELMLTIELKKRKVNELMENIKRKVNEFEY